MTRSGSIRGIERWRTDDPGYNVAVRLKVDGSTRPFIVRFDSKRRLLSFTPKPFSLHDLSQGLGYDSVKAPAERACCIAAVDKLNQHLHWIWYGRPAIQRFGSDYIVTFVTVSPAEEKEQIYMDPYVSFLVTPKGTVFGVVFGA